MDIQKNINRILDTAAALFHVFPKSAENFHEFTNYAEYLAVNTSNASTAAAQRENPPDISPLISIAIVCADETDEALDSSISSIIAQSYSNWEICLAADLARTGLERFKNTDAFRLVLSEGSERTLLRLIGKQLHGEYFMLLEPGDILAPDALYEMVKSLASNPNAEFIYADEDSTDETGKRCNPVFKPDCGKETVFSYNCVGKPFITARRVHEAIGGFTGTDKNALWEYALKAFFEAKKTVHTARIALSASLESGRTLPDSFAMVKTLNRLLKTSGTKPAYESLAGSVLGTCKLRFLAKKHFSAGIIIADAGNAAHLRRCIESIQMQSTYDCYRIFVADDGTGNAEMKNYLSALEHEKVISIVRVGADSHLPARLNVCAKRGFSEMLIFLSSETEILTPDFLEEFECFTLKKGMGAVGGKLVDVNNNIVAAGTVIGLKGWAGNPYFGTPDDTEDFLKCTFTGVQRNVSAVSGFFMAVKGETFFDAGMFDESFNGVGWDAELCVRLRGKGLRICFNPFAKAQLNGALLDYNKANPANLTRCYDCFRQTLIQGDKYFNANFDPAFSYPHIAVNPYPAIKLNPLYKG